MVLVGADTFIKRIAELMSDDDYAALQADLIEHPERGALTSNGGGLRNIRWATEKGKGKSGGSQIIYYWVTADDQIRMLYAYRKAKQ